MTLMTRPQMPPQQVRAPSRNRKWLVWTGVGGVILALVAGILLVAVFPGKSSQTPTVVTTVNPPAAISSEDPLTATCRLFRAAIVDARVWVEKGQLNSLTKSSPAEPANSALRSLRVTYSKLLDEMPTDAPSNASSAIQWYVMTRLAEIRSLQTERASSQELAAEVEKAATSAWASCGWQYG